MRAWHKNHVNPDTYRFEERRDSWRGSDRFVGAALRGRPSTGKTHVGRGRVYAEGRPRSAAPTESCAGRGERLRSFVLPVRTFPHIHRQKN